MNWFLENVMNIVITIGAAGAVIGAIFGILYFAKSRNKENPNIEMGFAKGDQVLDQIEVKSSPEIFDGHEVGQRIYFRVCNRSKFSIKTPICSVKFPELFKHIAFVDKPDGSREYFEGKYAINSDLWGLGRGSTELKKNLPNSMWEISSVAAYLLRSGDRIGFFVRFLIPKNAMDYELEMHLDAEGINSFSRKLKLVVNPN
jgi:hypothetical protein